MSYQGHIEDGVVVFDEPVLLPDGTEVLVERAPARSAPARRAAPDEFWRERSLEDLISEQGVAVVGRLEDVLGRGATLWESEHEFDEFLRNVRERRHEGMAS